MRVLSYADPDEFWGVAEAVVVAEPVLHSVLASVVDTLRRQPGTYARQEFYAVERQSQPPFLALHTPPYPFHLPTADEDAARALAEHVRTNGVAPTGAGGEVASVGAFAQRWGELTGQHATVSMRLGLYDLPGAAVLPRRVPGASRAATLDHRDLVDGWLAAFREEVHVAPLPGTSCLPALEDGRILLWCDPEPVAMAQASVAAGGVCRISYVYTPPEHRGHGYGSAVTAALSERVRGQGLRCMLYTDLANPTSNGIYAAIGYRRLGETVEVRFEDGAPAQGSTSA